MSGGHQLSEESLGKFVDRALENICSANFVGGFQTLSITKVSEGILGFDEAVWWEKGQIIDLSLWGDKKQSYFFPPLLFQYKVPDSNKDEFKFTIPRDQFVRMLLNEYLKHNAFYALSRVKMHSELGQRENDLSQILAFFKPSEMGVMDLGYEEYTLRINKNSGEIHTIPIKSKIGQEPYHIHPKEMMTKIIAEIKRLGIPRNPSALDPDLGMFKFELHHRLSNFCFCNK